MPHADEQDASLHHNAASGQAESTSPAMDGLTCGGPRAESSRDEAAAMRLASCASDDLPPKGAAEPPVATGQEYRVVSGGAAGGNSLGAGLTATVDAATPNATTPNATTLTASIPAAMTPIAAIPTAAGAGLRDGVGSRSADQLPRAAHPVAFPAAPPYPEALLPCAVCGNLVGGWGPHGASPAAEATCDGSDAGASSASGGSAGQGARDELVTSAAECAAEHEGATAEARETTLAAGAALHGRSAAAVREVSAELTPASVPAVEGAARNVSSWRRPGVAGCGAPSPATGAADQEASAHLLGASASADHRASRPHRGLTVASVALTVLACTLLVVAAFAARSILLPLAVGLAVVALVVASRAAMGGALSSRAFRLAQFVLVVVALAGVVVMASELMGVVR